MVSSSAPKMPPLSYADRAKKAQNLKSPSSAPPPRTPVQSVPPHSTSNVSTPSSNSTLSSSAPSNSNSNTTSVDGTPSSSIIHTTRPPSPLPQNSDATDVKPVNGDSRATKDLTSKALSIVAAHTSPQKPIANVWNVRMEQMAARSPHSSQLPASQSAPQLSKSGSRNQTSLSSRHSSDALSNMNLAVKQGNGSTTASPVVSDDPFVVRLPAQLSRAPPSPPPLPPVDDVESWPEVGKLLSPTTTQSAHSTPVVESPPETKNEYESSKGNEPVQAHTATPRKNEKTKWVPIPPEELQAAADALQSSNRHSRTHSRNLSQHNNGHSKTKSGGTNISRNNNNSQGGSGSASASISQSQSRTHSGRNSISHSVSQSRVHSRPGSVPSSPRHSRGRKLPGDDSFVSGASGYGAAALSAVNRSSGANSPSPLSVDLGLASGQSVAYPIPTYGPVPGNGQLAYYPQGPPQLPLPPMQDQNQQHYHPTTHSPLSAQFGLPSAGGYHSGHSPASMHPPPQPPYSGAGLPYQMYSPYGPYEYGPGPGPGQPYMYWNGHAHTHGSGQQSPSYPSQPVSHYPQPPPLHHNLQHHHPQYQEGIRSLGGQVPPPTMIGRPPPPEESQAVAGYRPLALVQGLGEKGGAEAFELQEKPVVFGSIGVPGASKCPSPAPPRPGQHDEDGENVQEKAFTVFSVGVSPGEPAPSRLRSRTRSSKTRSRTETGDSERLMSDLTNGEIREVVVGHDEGGKDGEKDDSGCATAFKDELRVIDLTDPEVKWEFGTTRHLGAVSPPAPDDQQYVTEMISPQPVHMPLGAHQHTGVSVSGSPILPIDNPSPLPMPLTSPPTVLPTTTPPISAPLPQQKLGPVLLSDEGSAQAGSDEFEVKDFGYGFGPASGTGYAPAITREERLARERERERERVERMDRERIEREAEKEQEVERDRQRDQEVERERERDRVRDREFSGPPRRGWYGGFGPDRGGFNGRRGRGFGGGRGFNRNFNRGFQAQQQRQPPFSITPPPHFQPLVPLSDPSNGYYPSAQQQPLATYIPMGYETYQAPAPQTQTQTPATPQVTPPVPTPLSSLSFPLDPTRWYLLGQLEYYLSPQNMAQDFFLRQRMDSCGWIPISLIASFNRVRQLTMDIRLVRDVLILSTMVQVKDGWVRMGGWERFVLPDAARSTVEEDALGRAEAPLQPHQEEQRPEHQPHESEADAGEGDAEGDVEEEEEEDVVFVMGREEQLWSPERRKT